MIQLPVKRYFMELGEGNNLDIPKLIRAWKMFIEATGWSWINEPEVERDFRIDENKYRSILTGFYVERDGMSCTMKSVPRAIAVHVDIEPLGSDVTGDTMSFFQTHEDGRQCSYHHRLAAYVTADDKNRLTLKCLREHNQ